MPADWKMMVIRRTMPTKTMETTCHRSMTVPSLTICSLSIKHRMRTGARMKRAAVRTRATALMKRMVKENSSRRRFLSMAPKQ